MSPVIRRLQEFFLDLHSRNEEKSCDQILKQCMQELNLRIYKEILPAYLIFNLEYNFLVRQLKTNLKHPTFSKQKVREELVGALILSELLRRMYHYYLIEPSEERRLCLHQKVYYDLLGTINHFKNSQQITLAFSQQINNTTVHCNIYRLLFLRAKRALDLIALLHLSDNYGTFIKILDKYTNTIAAYLTWAFYAPRLLVHLFLVLKHAVPGPWMGIEEKSLGWALRLNLQLKRRWFELCNDTVWVGIGLINFFCLTGVWAPIGAYFSIICFALDIVIATTRAYIELSQLYQLKKDYKVLQSMLNTQKQQSVAEYLIIINQQLSFEWLRLGSHVLTTTAIFLAACCTAPLFFSNPIIPIIGTIGLFVIAIINLALFHIIDNKRPRDVLEIKSGVGKFGLFAPKGQAQPDLIVEEQLTPQLPIRS